MKRSAPNDGSKNAQILAALSSPGDDLDPDSLTNLLKDIEMGMLFATTKDADGESRNLLTSCEALCAWCSKALKYNTLRDDDVERAFKLIILFADHRDATVSGIVVNAFQRLSKAVLANEQAGQPLIEFLKVQVNILLHDFRSVRRSIYVLLESLIGSLGVERILSAEPAFIVIILNSAFQKDTAATYQQELGNPLCNLVIRFMKAWLEATSFKITAEIKQAIVRISEIFQRGPDDIFACNYLLRRVVQQLFLNDVKVPTQKQPSGIAEEEIRLKAIREIGRIFLQNLPPPALWCRMNVLLSLERGGFHIPITHNEFSKTKKNSFSLDVDTLKTCLIHEQFEIRNASWALVTTRVKRSKFPDLLALTSITKCIQFVCKNQGLSKMNDVKGSLLRLFERIHSCLTSNNPYFHDDELDENLSVKKQALSDFIAKLSDILLVENLYPGAPMDRVLFPVQLISSLIEIFVKTNPKLIASLLHPSAVKLYLSLLGSEYDTARLVSFELLEKIPSPLPGLETSEQVQDLLERGRWLCTRCPMRRETDEGSLLLRLVFKKYVTQLGWKIHLGPLPSPDLKTTLDNWSSKLNEMVTNATQHYFMILACEQARNCVTVPTAYNVGCVIVNNNTGAILSTGFSREIPGNTHAEECALMKLAELSENTGDLCLYTTMEPCSTRLSGKESCTVRIIEWNEKQPNKIKRVVMGLKEPDKFVANCIGEQLLLDQGIVVSRITDEDVRNECLELNNFDDPNKKHVQFVNKEKRERFKSQMNQENLPRALVINYFLNQILLLLNGEKSPHYYLHGLFALLRYCVSDLVNDSSLKNDPELDLHLLLPVSLQVLTTSVDQLCQEEGIDCRGHIMDAVAVNNQDDDEEEEDVTMAYWLIIREGSELVSAILAYYFANPPSRLALAAPNPQPAFTWFLDALLRLRHLGAVSHVARALEHSCSHLFAPSYPVGITSVQEWVHSLFAKLGSDQYDKTLRRSEGFSLSFRAIARAAQQHDRPDVICDMIKQTIELAIEERIQDGEGTKKLVHAFNVLRGLFDDAVLCKFIATVPQFISQSLQEAVLGFRNPQWSVRNSALNLFVAIVKRQVGGDNSNVNEEDEEEEQSEEETNKLVLLLGVNGSRNEKDIGIHHSHKSVTAELFFQIHHSLFPFIYNELKRHEVHDNFALHPILVFLSCLKRRPQQKNSDETTTNTDLLLPLVENLAYGHPNYVIRTTASRTFVSLCPIDYHEGFLNNAFKYLDGVVKSDQVVVNGNKIHGVCFLVHLLYKESPYLVKPANGPEFHTLEQLLVTTCRGNDLIRVCILDVMDVMTLALVKMANMEAPAIYATKRFLTISKDLAFVDGEATAEEEVVIGGKSLRKRAGRMFIKYCLQTMVLLQGQAGESEIHVIWNEITKGITFSNILVRMACLECFVRGFPYWNNTIRSLPTLVKLSIEEALFAFELSRESGRESVQAEAIALYLETTQQFFCDQVTLSQRLLQMEASLSTNKSISFKSALCRILSLLPQANNIFIPLLRSNASSDAPLELRLSAATSLRGISGLVDDGDKLACWILALDLLQDDDREVCEVTRRVVIRLIDSPGGGNLNVVFDRTWSTITNWFYDHPNWRSYLTDLLLLQGATEEEKEERTVKRMYDAEDENTYKEFKDSTTYATRELVRIKSLLIQHAKFRVGDWVVFSAIVTNRFRLILERLGSETKRLTRFKRVFEELYSTFGALRVFGNASDEVLVWLLNQFHNTHVNNEDLPQAILLAYQAAVQTIYGL